MSDNSVVLLNRFIDEYTTQLSDSYADSEIFELFCIEQVLKNYDLSFEELLAGHTGRGRDGGIDGFYTFINGIPINEGTVDISTVGLEPKIEVYLIQAKRSNSFEEEPINKIRTAVSDLFDFNKDVEELSQHYNEKIIDNLITFQQAYLGLITNRATVQVNCVYASKGNTKTINTTLQRMADNLAHTISTYLHNDDNNKFQFLGANELLLLARKIISRTTELEYSEPPMSRGDNSFVVFCTLESYYNFITDDNSQLKRYLFQSNVRDYQGNVEVNKEIRTGLESEDETEFWWLNNGVTIISGETRPTAARRLVLENPQIVNGLQTTEEIYRYMSNNIVSDIAKNKAVLITNTVQ
jgi:hypothetical protein